MAKQSGLDMFWPERLAKQRIRLQVYLPDGQVVRRLPVALHALQLLWGEGARCSLGGAGFVGAALALSPPGLRGYGARNARVKDILLTLSRGHARPPPRSPYAELNAGSQAPAAPNGHALWSMRTVCRAIISSSLVCMTRTAT